MVKVWFTCVEGRRSRFMGFGLQALMVEVKVYGFWFTCVDGRWLWFKCVAGSWFMDVKGSWFNVFWRLAVYVFEWTSSSRFGVSWSKGYGSRVLGCGGRDPGCGVVVLEDADGGLVCGVEVMEVVVWVVMSRLCYRGLGCGVLILLVALV
ncbi:hypothetical protein Tco_0519064 [Tanacetum coccineum]